MDIELVHNESKRKWIAEVWEPMTPEWEFREPYPDDTYIELNDWCFKTFGYHARTAYHIFEFDTESDANWFVLRWA